jgi:hypothetical protein
VLSPYSTVMSPDQSGARALFDSLGDKFKAEG